MKDRGPRTRIRIPGVKETGQPTDKAIGRSNPGANPEQPMGSLSRITVQGGENGKGGGNIAGWKDREYWTEEKSATNRKDL